MKKICSQCKEEKYLTEFNKCKKSKDGVLTYCKVCKNITRRKNRELNKDKRNEAQKKYFLNNTEQHEKSKKRSLEYYKNNTEKFKDYRAEYEKIRIKTDKIFLLRRRIKCNISGSIKRQNHNKTSKTEDILGCSFEEFKKYIESKFELWMTWENYGLYNGELNYGWDLDHIIPIASAKSEEDVIKLNHYTNFQPLCSKFNRVIKKDKI